MPRIRLFAPGLALSFTLALAAGCDRDAEPLLCGDLAAGDLVISEVRGGPGSDDSDGAWIELYNGSGAAIELHGVTIAIGSDGSDRLLVRRPLPVAAGGYVVVGQFDDGNRPAHVDVGWGMASSVPERGRISISCGVELDVLDYTAQKLPDPQPVPPGTAPLAERGTYSLGAMPPTATANDDAAAWCADPTETLGPCNPDCVKYYRGSPGEPNRACPAPPP